MRHGHRRRPSLSRHRRLLPQVDPHGVHSSAKHSPNPFNPQTTIHYDIPAGGADVNISIYDVAGRLVREFINEHRAAGTWSVQWNGDDANGQRVASGVYFYRMRAEALSTRKRWFCSVGTWSPNQVARRSPKCRAEAASDREVTDGAAVSTETAISNWGRARELVPRRRRR